MKNAFKKTLLLLGLFVFFASISVLASAQGTINVTIDGEALSFDVEPQIINDRTMVPMRKIFEYFGAEVTWNNDTQGITAVKDNVIISMQINSCDMFVNDEKITLDVGPVIVNGRTLVPVRAVSEAFDAYVGWENNSKTVHILTNKSDIPQKAQGVWRYLHAEKDGTVIPKEQINTMDIFNEDFTIEIRGVYVYLKTEGMDYSSLGLMECKDDAYTIMDMNLYLESDAMKLYSVKENTYIVFEKVTEEKIQPVSKVYENKDWVYSAEVIRGFYVDGVGNDCFYNYYVPAINISSEDAQSINAEIYDEIFQYYQETLESEKVKESLFIYEISYEYYVNDDVVSLGVSVFNDWGATETKWYNINKKTGKRISNAQLISFLGYTNEEFVSILKEITGAYYVALYENNVPQEYVDLYWERYAYTISDKACNMSIPMYIGENGNLYIVGDIGSIAGASHYEHTIDTNLKMCASAPTFTIGRALECISVWENANASLSCLYPLNSYDTIEVVISEDYKETAQRVIGADSREEVREYILEYVTVDAEKGYGVTNKAFEMGGVEHNGKLYAYMPGYGPAFYLKDTAVQIDDMAGLKCVSIAEEHTEEYVYIFCFAIENGRWKIAYVIEREL